MVGAFVGAFVEAIVPVVPGDMLLSQVDLKHGDRICPPERYVHVMITDVLYLRDPQWIPLPVGGPLCKAPLSPWPRSHPV
jgi:hypothetical protein